jgi:hypothetical protein
MTIRGVDDLDGNGVPDVVAGSQLLSSGTGGWVYALQGNESLVSTPADEGPAALHLGQACPNPARGATAWSLGVEQAGSVRLILFSPDGRRVRDLGERLVAAGAQAPIAWDGRDQRGESVPAGVYLARLLYNNRPAAERRVVVIR